ncbi:hypothetical protein HDK77DRAFT_426712 [Phyllosticta capitalensis]
MVETRGSRGRKLAEGARLDEVGELVALDEHSKAIIQPVKESSAHGDLAQEPDREKSRKKRKRRPSKWATQKATEKSTASASKRHQKPRKPPKEMTTRWTEEDLKPWRGYPALYKERRKSKTFIRQNLSFTDDLPPEIRLMVYQELQEIDDELLEIYSKRIGFCIPEAQRLLFPMLRLCRTVYREIGQMLYGKVLKFTGPAAFFSMGAFMFSHQSLAFQYVRHIVVDIPSFSPQDVKYGVQYVANSRLVEMPEFLSTIMRKKNTMKATTLAFKTQCEWLQQLKSLRRLDLYLNNTGCNPWRFSISKRSRDSKRPTTGMECHHTDGCLDNWFGKRLKSPVEAVRDHLNPHFWETLELLKAALPELLIRIVISPKYEQKLRQLTRRVPTHTNGRVQQPGTFCFKTWILRRATTLGWELGVAIGSKSKWEVASFALPRRLSSREEVYHDKMRAGGRSSYGRTIIPHDNYDLIVYPIPDEATGLNSFQTISYFSGFTAWNEQRHAEITSGSVSIEGLEIASNAGSDLDSDHDEEPQADEEVDSYSDADHYEEPETDSEFDSDFGHDEEPQSTNLYGLVY